jgi:hypothetical protein
MKVSDDLATNSAPNTAMKTKQGWTRRAPKPLVAIWDTQKICIDRPVAPDKNKKLV